MSLEFESLTADFAREALGLLEKLEDALLSLERAGTEEREPLLASIRRGLHTLKGNAGMVGATTLGLALHGMEDGAERLVAEPERASRLLGDIDTVRAEVQQILDGRPVEQIGQALKELAEGLDRAPSSASETALPAMSGELRLPQARIDRLVAVAGELVVQNARLQRLLGATGADPRHLRDGADKLDQTIRLLHEEILRVRMVPVSQLFSRFRRLVRDEAKAQGKQAELHVVGASVEVDKEVLDRLCEALVHLVRNAVAHGIELPEQRIAAGKPAEGRVTLSAAPSGDRIEISVQDDGRGLDEAAIRARARERGLDPELGPVALVFHPGFSTSELTQSAGRGVGLDAVQRSVYQFGGTLDMSWTPGRGSRVSLRVPTSIALQRALLCDLGGETYAVPVANVLEAARLAEQQVRWLGNGAAIEHRGRLVPVVDTKALLGLPKTDGGYAVLLQAGHVAALRVDALLGQQDFVFQPLDPSCRGDAPVSAGALLGDGRVVLRLDPETLVTAASRPTTELRA